MIGPDELAANLEARYPTIDVLANNAGGVFGTRETNLLLPALIRSRATVLQTASIAARLYGRLDLSDLDNDRHFSANRTYGDSKLANILFTRELNRRFPRPGDQRGSVPSRNHRLELRHRHHQPSRCV